MTPLSASVLSWWNDIRTALAFLTRLPNALGTPRAPRELGPALRAAPLVGVVVGLVGAAVFWVAVGLGLPPALAGLLAVGATAWATGALHEDGLADVADGFGGAVERTRKLEIMRDSRTGAFGVLALILSVGLRAGALAAIAESWLVATALISAHAASRAALPLVMAALPPARSDGLGASAGRPSRYDALAGALLGVAAAVLALGPSAGLILAIVAGLAAIMAAALARRQVGGYTGDVLGAVQQTAEVAALLAAAAVLA